MPWANLSRPFHGLKKRGCWSALLIPLTIGLLIAPTGCSERDKRQWQMRSPEQNFETALEAKSGDERRDAVARIAESGYSTRDDAFHVLDAVARTDPVAQVRCIAIRTFAGYPDERPIKPLLIILQTGEGSSSRDALPANADVRWEVARSLLALKHKNVVDEETNASARDAFLKMLQDPARNVRLIGIEGLGEYKDAKVLEPLIKTLRTEDFAIADRAERSLIQLTGTTQNYDAQAWEKWVASTPDPFAHAGEQPPMTRPAGPSWWELQMRAWRRGLKLGRQD